MNPYNVKSEEGKRKKKKRQAKEEILKQTKKKGNVIILCIAILSLGSSHRPPFFLQILRLYTSESCGPVF